jgi:autotransporter adhesin
MNKAYRVIWNETTGIWMAVSELARGKGKRSRSDVSAKGRASADAMTGPLPASSSLLSQRNLGREARWYWVAMATLLTSMSGGEVMATSIYCNDKSNNNYPALACGTSATAVASGDVALGTSVSASSSGQDYSAVAIGASTTVTNAGIGIGSSSNVSGVNAVLVGNKSTASQSGAVSLGYSVTNDGLLAIGSSITNTKSGSISLGATITNSGQNAVALGWSTSVSADGGVALGTGTTVSVKDAVALGSNSTADRLVVTSVADPLSYNSSAVTSGAGAVSVGSSTIKRQITNVAAGTQATDAANVGQVSAVKTVVDTNATRMASALGGGSTVGSDGTISAPSYSVGGTAFSNVGSALSNLDTRTSANNTAVTAAQSQLSTLDGVAAKYDDTTKGAMTLGGKDGTKVTNLQDAALSASSRDAVTGRQLNTTNTNVTNLTNTVSGLGTRVTTAEGNIDSLTSQISNISSGTTGLVQQDATTKKLTVGKSVGGTEVSFAGQDAEGNATQRKLTDVADGTNANDAANFGQLSAVKATADQNTASIAANTASITANAQATASALGGGATVGADGTVTAPSYTLDGKTFNNVGGTLGNLDGRVTKNATDIAQNSSDISNLSSQISNISSGTTGLVQQDATTKKLTVGKSVGGTEVSIAGQDAEGNATQRKLTDVADGTNANDAANFGQLSAVKATADQSKTDIGTLSTTVSGIGTRVTTAEGNIDSLTSQISNISSGTTGLVQQDATTKKLTVGKSVGGTEVSFAGQDAEGNATQRKLTDVADGTNANDAANFGQLSAVKAATDQSKTDIAANTASITANAQATASALGGGATVGTDGTVTAPSYTLDGKTFNNVGGALGNLDGRVTKNATDIAQNSSDISNLSSQISSGSVGLVQQDATTKKLTVGKSVGGTEVSIAGQDEDGNEITRKLTGLSNGEISATSNQAVTGKQLYSTANGIANALGGGASVNPDGTLILPTYAIGGTTQNNVSDALKNLDDRVMKNTSAIDQLASGGGSGGSAKNSIQYDTDAHNSVTMGNGSDPVSVKNVKNGNVAQDSTDAVNGGQLWDTNQKLQSLDQRVTNNQTTGNANVSIKSTSARTASASGDASTAIGGGSVVSGNNSTALGENAVASGNNSVALGQGSAASEDNTVSVGSDSSQRRVTNVANGQRSTDAANMGQLSQLRNDMNNSINSVARAAYGGIAAAMAMPNMTPSGPGRTVVAAGAANYKGYNAVAAGATYRSRDGKMLVNGALSVTQSGEAGVRAQVGYEF